LDAFHARGLDAAVVGEIDASGELVIRAGDRQALVLDLATTTVTGLTR